MHDFALTKTAPATLSSMIVPGSLQVLFEEIFDYAGLFPPAALPMDEAIPQYHQHLQNEEAWLVSKFVCPLNWLPEFHQHFQRISNSDKAHDLPWPVTVLGTSIEGYRADVANLERFHAEFGSDVAIDGYEVKLGLDSSKNGNLKILAKEERWDVYIEVPWSDQLDDNLELIASYETLGTKARLGGLEASAIPSAAQVARFMRGSVDLEMPFKLTAGLHQPLRHFDDKLGCKLHGFLNVAVAGALAVCWDLPDEDLISVLEAEDPAQFVVRQDSITFGEWELTADDLEQSRELGLHTIGSCSILEPLEGLHNLYQ